MILGMEIALTVAGLYMLITGKGWGKDVARHWGFRLLGAFILTLLPVAIVTMVVVAVVYAVSHPNLSQQQMQDALRLPGAGIEFGIVVLYVVIATLWEKAIRRRVAAEAAAEVHL